MATKENILKDNLRDKWVDLVKQMLIDMGEETLMVGSNKIGIPTLDSEGNEQSIVITVSVPNGQRGGDGYDVYTEAQAYEVDRKRREERDKAKALAKARKQAKDEELRQKKKGEGV